MKHSFLILLSVLILVSTSLVAQTEYWQTTSLEPYARNSTQIIVKGNDGSLIAGGNTLYRSTDNGLTWSDVIGAPIGRINDILVLPNGKIFLATEDGIFSANSLTDEWKLCSLPRAYATAIGISTHNILFARTTTIYSSSDLGATWNVAGKGLPKYMGTVGHVPFVMGPNGEVFVGGDQKAYVSRDDGKKWSRLPLQHYYPGTQIKFAFQTNGTLVGMTMKQFANQSKKTFMYVSTNIGRTWKTIKSKNGPEGLWTLIAGENNTLFAGTTQGVITSNDNGKTWTRLSQTVANMNGDFEWALALVVTHDNHLVAGTNKGIIRSTNPVFASNAQNAPSLSVSDEVKSFALLGNYPNPFNPSTMIHYQLPHDSYVTLTVYNTLGEEVAKLMDGMQEAGEHTVDFNGSNLSSGVYIYRITINGQDGSFSYTDTKRMVLLK